MDELAAREDVVVATIAIVMMVAKVDVTTAVVAMLAGVKVALEILAVLKQ